MDCYFIENGNENDLMHLLYEMDAMKTIGPHKNIVNLIGACTLNGKRNCSITQL